MAKESRDDGQKGMKRVVKVAPDVFAISQRTIRRTTSSRYLFKNRINKVSPNFSRC